MQQIIFIADFIACSKCFRQYYAHHQELYNTLELLLMGIVLPETCWACNKICNKYNLLHLVGILFPHNRYITLPYHHELSPCSRIPPEQLTTTQLDLRTPCSYGTRCRRSPPIYYLCPCLAQYSSRDVFGMRVGFIESERIFLLVTTEFLFYTTVFLFMESG